MSSSHEWRIQITNLKTNVCVGIYDHEREPQPVVVNALITGKYPARPQTIEDCFDYSLVHRFVTVDWSKREHVGLLEILVVELLEFIFSADSRVQYAKVSVCKTDISAVEAIGSEAEWTRADYKRLRT